MVGDEGAMKQLEALVHPLVSQERNSFLHKVSLQGDMLCQTSLWLPSITGCGCCRPELLLGPATL